MMSSARPARLNSLAGAFLAGVFCAFFLGGSFPALVCFPLANISPASFSCPCLGHCALIHKRNGNKNGSQPRLPRTPRHLVSSHRLRARDVSERSIGARPWAVCVSCELSCRSRARTVSSSSSRSSLNGAAPRHDSPAHQPALTAAYPSWETHGTLTPFLSFTIIGYGVRVPASASHPVLTYRPQ